MDSPVRVEHGKQWKAEYAKSGRSACKSCKLPISKDSFRIAKISHAKNFDGFMTSWHHAECFLKYPGQFQATGDIDGFGDLTSADQEKINDYLKNIGNILYPSDVDGINESVIEKSATSRATCKSCNQKISKGEVRISTMADPENPWSRSTMVSWHHAECFFKIGWWSKPINLMSGWDKLSPEDQILIQGSTKENKQVCATEGSTDDNKDSNEKSNKKRTADKFGTNEGSTDDNKDSNEKSNKKRTADKKSEGHTRKILKKSGVEMGGVKGERGNASILEERHVVENHDLRAVHEAAKAKLEEEFSSVPLPPHQSKVIECFSGDQKSLMKAVYQACQYKKLQEEK